MVIIYDSSASNDEEGICSCQECSCPECTCGKCECEKEIATEDDTN